MATMYPSLDGLSAAQRKSYLHIKKQLDNKIFVSVKSQYSYIMLYLNELISTLTNPTLSCDHYASRIDFISANYSAPFIQDYCSIWLGDIYYVYGEYSKALDTWVKALNPRNTWTLLSSKIISLKLHEDLPLSAVEALTYRRDITKYGSRNITEYGKSNFELVLEYVDNIIQRDYQEKTISSEFFLASQTKRLDEATLFNGSTFGYHINEFYQQRSNRRKQYNIDSLETLTRYLSELCRRAENAMREDKGLPLIGEGWIAETDLYYRIKNYFPSFTVIQHYNAPWLGRQHLDVFIVEPRIGIEFHGQQHFEPIEFFGGEEAYKKNVKRDKAKAAKCSKASVKLFVVTHGYNFDGLVEQIEEHMRSIF